MTEELTYAEICVKEPRATLKFLTQYLGFINISNLYNAEEPGKPGFLLRDKSGRSYFIPLSVDNGDYTTTIIINTDDCLRDYYLLDKAGVQFDGIPGYTSDGLQAIAVDDNGTRYTLLEHRDYTDEL
ncbi:MAG: VOC family protein [Mucilaginibacter sp.]